MTSQILVRPLLPSLCERGISGFFSVMHQHLSKDQRIRKPRQHSTVPYQQPENRDDPHVSAPATSERCLYCVPGQAESTTSPFPVPVSPARSGMVRALARLRTRGTIQPQKCSTMPRGPFAITFTTLHHGWEARKGLKAI